jgi:hypothetical protein
MNRWLWTLVIALFSTAGAGCNTPTCGAGTKQVQKPNGELVCLPVDAQPATETCNASDGVHLVGGNCVANNCGPDTVLDQDAGVCVGVGGGTAVPHVPETCPTPPSDSICVNGVVRHLVDNSFLMPGETVRVAAYEPLRFLANPNNPPIVETTTDDTYIFKAIPASSVALGLITIGVTDVNGTTTPVLQTTGTGAQIVAGKSYQVDVYATPKAVFVAWSTQSNGVDFDAAGAYVMKFYADAAPPMTLLTATETMPVAGVVPYQGAVPAPNARYFGSSLLTIDPTLTATGSLGVAVVPGVGDIKTYTGMGGGITWEGHPGGTAPHVVFVDRYHPKGTM